MMKKKLMIKTAFACMACDGSLDTREVECVRQFIQDEDICPVDELKNELDKLVDEFNLDANTFMSQFFSDLHHTDLTEDDQLKIISYALAIIRADKEIDYREIKFFKIIRSLLSVADEEIRAKFEDIDEFLAEDILSDPYISYYNRSFFSTSGVGDIMLSHIGQGDE
jgi:uncharacterized tellurite resistance protein B-like protein